MKLCIAILFPLMVCTLPLSAMADQPLVVAGLGGAAADVVKSRLIPEFEKKFRVKVVYYPENSADTLQRLRSDKENGKNTDVAFMDDSLMDQAVDGNLCGKIESNDSKDFEKTAHFQGDKAMGIGIVALGLMYNKKIFAENNWPAPTSWRDLADPKFSGKVTIASPKNGYGMTTLLALAYVNGGVNEKGIDAAFGVIKNSIVPLTPALANTPAKLLELFQTGQVALVPWGSVRAQQLFIETGFPVGIAYPKEGVPTVLVAVCPVQASKNHVLAQAFIKMVLSEEAQKLFTDEAGLFPLRKNTPVKNTGFLPIGVNPIVIDQKFVIRNREVWNERWLKDVGKLD